MKTDRIRALAKEKGLSLSFICSKLGVAHVYFIDIDKSGRDIPEDKLNIIADLLNTTPEYLKGETEIKEKPSGNTTEGPITPKDQIINEIVKHLKSSSLDEVKRFDRMLDAFLADRQK